MRPPLTRRGWAVAALTAGCLVMAAWFGARSLNAVVAPGLAALAAALLTVHRAERPSVERVLPEDGFPGERGVVELRVDGDRAGVYRLRDAVPPDLAATPAEHHVGGASDVVDYEVAYERRGAYEFGPVSVALTDALGLARREFSVEAGDGELLVYPPVVSPPEPVRAAVAGFVDPEQSPGRDEFDRLRQYDRSDALRDVHWKTSAKLPDDELVVKEFHRETPTHAVRIAAGARGSIVAVDSVARAAASVATHLLDAGVDVGLVTPTASVEPGLGPEQQRAVLEALARLESGSLPETEADVRVEASDRTAVCRVRGRSLPFEDADGRGRRAGAAGDERRTTVADGGAADGGASTSGASDAAGPGRDGSREVGR